MFFNKTKTIYFKKLYFEKDDFYYSTYENEAYFKIIKYLCDYFNCKLIYYNFPNGYNKTYTIMVKYPNKKVFNKFYQKLIDHIGEYCSYIKI